MLAVSDFPSDKLNHFSVLSPSNVDEPIRLNGRAITENYLVVYLDSNSDLAVIINQESKTIAPLHVSYDELVLLVSIAYKIKSIIIEEDVTAYFKALLGKDF